MGSVVHDPAGDCAIYGNPLSYICFEPKNKKGWNYGWLFLFAIVLKLLWDQLAQ